MGKEKKLFLLAVMTVMMSTAGYSAQIPVGKDENKSNPTEKVLEVGDETGVDNKGTFTNNGTINVKTDKTTGVFGILNNAGTSTNNGTIKTEKENKGTAIKISGGTVTNSSTGKIELNEGKGIYVAAIKDKNNNYVEAKLENTNKIEINNGTGINMQVGTVINESTGEIVINKTNNGIVLGHNNSSFENKGTITIKEKAASADEKHNAIKVSKGELKNSGTITNGDKILIENGKFVNEKGGTVTNETTGKITITGGEFTNNTDGTVNNAGEIIISGGNFNNAEGTVTNSGKVSISGGKLTSNEKGIITNNKNGIIDITSSKEKEIALELKGELENKEGATINITSSGINSVGIQQGTPTGAITNNGTINITSSGNNAIGINIKNGVFTNNKDIDITVSGGNANTSGIKQDAKDGKTENNGIINITASNGAGILVNNGEFENNNKIIVNQGTGIKVISANGNFFNTGIIEVNGENAVGIDVTNGKLEKTNDNKNNGTIYVNGNKSVGIKTTNDKKQTANNDGNIIVSGEGAMGMYAYSGGTVINKENIYVGTTTEKAKKGSSGIKAYKAGKAQNDGVIYVNGENSIASNGGLGESGGTVINNKEIYVEGNYSSGLFGKNTGTTVTNEKDAKIFVSKNSVGIKLEDKATGENKGIINVQEGTGVTLKGESLFVNSGTINGVTEAIKSLGGDNTVYLKDGSNITGKIIGADGVDVLGLRAGTYSNLNVNDYEAVVVRDGDIKVSNSTISLKYNEKTDKKLEASKENMDKYDAPDKSDKVIPKVDKGNLVLNNSNLIINIGNKKAGELGTMVDAKEVTLENVKFGFKSDKGDKTFNITDILTDVTDGVINDKTNLDYLGSNSTAIWNYSKNESGDWIANRKTFTEASKSQLKEFSELLDKNNLTSYTEKLEFLSQGEFDRGMAQMSGGVHGYIADFAALNARTMTNTMRNRALTRDYMRKRPLNSWTQDISYIDNNHRLGGLMNVDYTEKGVLGISEKQILPNGKLGLVYGGSKGNAKFEGGENGSSTLDGAYFGGYYNHEFNNKWSLNSNANFVYTHNKVTRNVNFADINENFKSAYPTYTVGMGTSLIYTVKDDLRNKAHFYAGVDVERIMIGNINENKDIAKDETGLAIKTTSYNPRTYYSIVPSAGFMVQNTGYVFDRKYRIGADLNWETEVGDIKDGKRLKLTGLDKEYKVETSERENVFSYSLFGALDLTESLSVNARYTSMFSDEYDADMIGAGFEYKMDTMADNFFGTLAHKIENNRPFSDRWGGTFGLIMETDDVDDYTKYDDGHPTSGDVATSMEYKPKMILSLNDKQSNWSYYFEAYHKTNNMFGSIKADERESHASRYHGEARWNDTYSKGSYGMSFGYRNENSRKSDYYASNKTREIVKNGTHELRITPSFTYDLGHGFTLGGKSAIVFMYKYEGDRAGQMDMNTESQIGFTYTGFMPRWSIIANFYREDTWYDHSYEKITNGVNKAPKNDQVNQLRPSIIYYFGNGASFRFDARIPLGNGSWANLNDGTNGNQAYETRYGFNYYYPVTPGFTVNVGGIFLNNKTKNKDHSGGKYGNITRGYAFRPNIGFYYSF